MEDDFEHVNLNSIQQQIRIAQERSLDSTKRSLALIDDSHDVAIKTAEELQYQGEQLDRTEKNLDHIHNDMAVANRNIKSMKSIWGTMTNYFKKAPKQTVTENENKSSHVSHMLGKESCEFSTSDAERETYGYGDKPARPHDTSSLQRSGLTTSKDPYERQLDANLDLMARGLSRLKEDALCLGGEIERQNTQLDRITDKAERADFKIDKARKDIKKML
ncbi:predicted protein [Nematostella vectensis]|uniref:t-SNARE coiled-coil homology domain-containing protein n=1 Tax=Nematostella vectensis TaxID=45351 RepID=A7S8P1_NEMVE|nr:predicted protein [Nematostella vectensis]|eukprot:XP_001631922.1 predicted protein [Nematostella vectensis]